MNTTITQYRRAFKLAAFFLIFALVACRDSSRTAEKSGASLTLASEVFEGVADPRALGSATEALKAMAAFLPTAVKNPAPSAAARNLAILSLDWGYNDDAFIFSTLAAKEGDVRGIELEILTNYLLGKRRSNLETGLAIPSRSYSTAFEALLDDKLAANMAARQFKDLVVAAGNDAPFVILAFVSHPEFKNSRENLNWLSDETCRFFAFHSAVNCKELDAGAPSQTVETGKHVFDPVGRFYRFTLVAAAISKRFNELGDTANAELWAKRANTSLTAARSAGDWRPGWDSTLKLRGPIQTGPPGKR